MKYEQRVQSCCLVLFCCECFQLDSICSSFRCAKIFFNQITFPNKPSQLVFCVYTRHIQRLCLCTCLHVQPWNNRFFVCVYSGGYVVSMFFPSYFRSVFSILTCAMGLKTMNSAHALYERSQSTSFVPGGHFQVCFVSASPTGHPRVSTALTYVVRGRTD